MSSRNKAKLRSLSPDAPDFVSVQQKWDGRYAAFDPQDRREPVPFVKQCLPRLPVTGRALDVAAGAGRHSVVLAQHGLQVDAVDISWQGLRLARQRALEANFGSEQIRFIVANIEQTWLPYENYDVILVTFFLHRPLFPLIKRRLLPGGWLVYQTFTNEPGASAVPKPSSPDFLLNPGELETAFADFEILIYAERDYRGYPTAQLFARKPASAGYL